MTDRNVPVTTRGKNSNCKSSDYPFQFPNSGRSVVGNFSVEESKNKLKKFYLFHFRLAKTIAGWIIQIPEFEIKIELAHHVHYHMEAASLFRGRLSELRMGSGTLDNIKDSDIKIIEEELLQAIDVVEFLGGYLVVFQELVKEEENYCCNTDQLADLPTIRLIQKIKVDTEPMLEWCQQVKAAFIIGGVDAAGLNLWEEHVLTALKAVGGIAGSGSHSVLENLRQKNSPPFVRSIECARDCRFNTFHNTRDYKTCDDASTGLSEYEKKRLELLRIQRDEIDAIETFANVFYDLDDAPFDMLFDLSRFIWDEARHAEIGHQSLRKLGYDPFEVPCGLVGINVRSPLPPELAFAQISIFGELQIVGPMRELSKNAYKCGDHDTGRVFDFIYSDEVIHIKKGRKWLRELEPTGNLDSLAEKARVQAINRLREEGILQEDYSTNLTPEEIHELIGGE